MVNEMIYIPKVSLSPYMPVPIEHFVEDVVESAGATEEGLVSTHLIPPNLSKSAKMINKI